MKRWSVLLCLLAVTLTGCQQTDPDISGSPNSPAASDTETTVPEITTETEPEPTTEEPSTTIPEETDPPVHSLRYELYDTGVTLWMDDVSQKLELGYKSYKDYIVVADFDFDGYEDIFISFENDIYSGQFYRYDLKTEQFTPWDTLNEFGHRLTVDGQNLVAPEYDKYWDSFTTYQWKDTQLEPILFEDRYYTWDGIVSDFYEFREDGSKVLFERQICHSGTSTLYKVLGRDEVLYFVVDDNCVNVMRDGNVLQTIDTIDLKALLRDKVGDDSRPEKFLSIEDYDFDGYDDLYIPTGLDVNPLSEMTIRTRAATGEFYHFDPVSEMFTPWEELNTIGVPLILHEEEETLFSFAYDPENKSSESKMYYWDNGALCLSEWKYQYPHDAPDTKHGKYCDYYDSDGTLIKRIYRYYDQNKNETIEEEVAITP